MGIRIIAVGKIKTDFYKSACDEYMKRLSRYCKVEVIEIRSHSGNRYEENIKRESKDMLKYIRRDRVNVLLDERGKMLSSKDFANMLESWMSKGKGEIVFFIGGTDGVDAKVKERLDIRIALSRMTFTHEMARVILLEQIYRAFRIKNGEPYHH